MKYEDLLDLTLREVLEKYCAVHNPECCFYYGIFKLEDVNKICEEYNVDDEYPEAFCPESIFVDDCLMECDEIRDYDTLVRIMDNLGVSKKEKK